MYWCCKRWRAHELGSQTTGYTHISKLSYVNLNYAIRSNYLKLQQVVMYIIYKPKKYDMVTGDKHMNVTPIATPT